MATFNKFMLASDLIPMFYGDGNVGSTKIATCAISASTDTIEVIFQMPAADTITKLAACISARNAGTPVVHTISLQGVTTATGRADGTIKSATNAKATFTPPANSSWDGTVQWQTLTSSYTAAAGEYLAIVITAATASAGNNVSFCTGPGNSSAMIPFPYRYEATAGGAATLKGKGAIYGAQSASSTYGFPIANINSVVFDSAATPNERGFAFTLGNPATGTSQLAGLRFLAQLPATGKTCSVILYGADPSTTPAQTATLYGNVLSGFNTTNDGGVCEVFFPGLTTLNYGTKYRVGFQPQGTSTGFALRTFDVAASGDLSAFGGGSNIFTTTRSGGAWTDITTQRPAVDLILADSTPSGGAGISATRILGGM